MLNDGEIVLVDRVRLAHAPDDHPFHLAHGDAARANWVREVDRQPALFDGLVMLASTVDVRDGALAATCHLVPYSTFLYWRQMRPVAGTVHIFAMALPVAADGAVIAGRMSGWTANPGVTYCPSGSFDSGDIDEGRFAVDANMQREVAEETGLDLEAAAHDPGYYILPIDGAIVIFRAYRFAEPAAVLLDAVERHISSDPQSELACAVAIGGAADADSSFAAHMGPILASHFRA